MKSFQTCVTLAVLLSLSSAKDMGIVHINEDGKQVPYHIVAEERFESLIQVKDDAVTFHHGARAYLAIDSIDELDPLNYKKCNLLGKTYEYDIDLSNVGCSCNAAVYLTSMPGRDINGKPDPSKDGDFYCDAN